jgi:hypothetical protein
MARSSEGTQAFGETKRSALSRSPIRRRSDSAPIAWIGRSGLHLSAGSAYRFPPARLMGRSGPRQQLGLRQTRLEPLALPAER